MKGSGSYAYENTRALRYSGFRMYALVILGVERIAEALAVVAESQQRIGLGSRDKKGMEDDMAKYILQMQQAVAGVVAHVDAVRQATQEMAGDQHSLDKGAQASIFIRCRLFEFAQGIRYPAAQAKLQANLVVRALTHAAEILASEGGDAELKGGSNLDEEGWRGRKADDDGYKESINELVSKEAQRLRSLRSSNENSRRKGMLDQLKTLTAKANSKGECVSNKGFTSQHNKLDRQSNGANTLRYFRGSPNAISDIEEVLRVDKGGQSVAVLYENQRFRLVKGWSNDMDVKAGDPYSFSDLTGRMKLQKDLFSLPSGWRWESEWKVSITNHVTPL